MARAQLKTKNKAGTPYSCAKCADKIVAGQKYYKWSFRYGGTHRQHATHGAPTQSQLTQSKMSGVYAAIEAAEAAIAAAVSVEDLSSALNDCASAVGDVRQEYEDGLENLPDGLRDAGGPGGQTQEKIDALQEFCDSLESTASDLESEEFEAEEKPDASLSEEANDVSTQKQNWLEERKQQASDALSGLNV